LTAAAPVIRLGIVGSGGMAEYHARKFSALPGVAVSACSNRSLEHARGFAERMGIPHWFASTAEMAKSGEVDCVSTAVVDSGHARAALDVLERRLPVFAEKPLARTLPEAELMLAGARAANVPAVVNFSKRNAEPVALARRLVAEGRLGRIRGASFHYLQSWLLNDAWGRWDITPRWRWRVAVSTSTEGVLGDLGSHIIDSVRFILGEIQSVSCAVTTFTPDPSRPDGEGAPDTWAALFRMEPGFLVSARASWRAPGCLDSFAFTVEGDQGTIAADLAASRNELRLFDSKTGAWTELKAPPVRSTYEQFLGEVRGESTEGPGFSEGVEVQRVIAACSVSAGEGREVPLGTRA
jgi:predicted dehydrogenase